MANIRELTTFLRKTVNFGCNRFSKYGEAKFSESPEALIQFSSEIILCQINSFRLTGKILQFITQSAETRKKWCPTFRTKILFSLKKYHNELSVVFQVQEDLKQLKERLLLAAATNSTGAGASSTNMLDISTLENAISNTEMAIMVRSLPDLDLDL